MKNKTVLMFSYIDYPHPAGITRRKSGVAEVLNAKGIKVKVLVPMARVQTVSTDCFSNSIKANNHTAVSEKIEVLSNLVQII